MASVSEVAHAVGASLLGVVVEGRSGEDVRDVFVSEPDDPAVGQRGDLVLGIGTATPGQAVALVQRCVDGGASGLVLRRGLAAAPEVAGAAEGAGLSLLGLRPGLAWAHVVWLLRGIVDRSHVPGTPVGGDALVHTDLFALADAAAAVVDAPVTIEDNRSRVLAYSSGQAETDPARVSTIVGRRVPEDVVAHFRSRGVFRRLARSSDPFLVPGRPDGTRPRLVVPVRAGGEWLGSIWAVVDGPVDGRTTAELRNAASVVALHLLHLRAQADVARRGATDRLRAGLREFSPGHSRELALPPSPWRVVALTSPEGHDDVAWHLETWEITTRRHGWAAAALADLDGVVLAVVADTDDAGPGTWAWLRRIVADLHREEPAVRAAAGGTARTVADLPRSRAEAVELLGLLAGRHGVGEASGPAVLFEQAWAALTVQRAVDALDVDLLGGPLGALVEHDARHRTEYVATLGSWLRHYGDPRAAARELVVHPNTLRYRMKQLSAVADLDLDRPLARLALQLQVAALGQRPAPPGSAGAGE